MAGSDEADGELLGRFDYIIVGAGTAGCLLANRLSADPKRNVLLLEAGGKDNWIWFHIPVGYLYSHGNPRADWCFKTEPDPGLNGRSLSYTRGKVLGGCSTINGMIYMRGQAADYDHWRQLGNVGWSWEDVLPVFRKTEDHFAGRNGVHGAGGEWRVEEQRLSWSILDIFREAAAEVGIPSIDDFNGGDNEGCSYFQVNQRKGVRWHTAKAFLQPARGRSNLTVLTNAQTERLLLDGRRVTGVQFRQGGSLKQALAHAEVILAAGSIGSPQILQLSGIGPGPLLAEHGIDVVHELPGVGENLQDHLQLRLAYKVQNIRTLNEISQSLIGKAKMAIDYALFKKGPLTMAPSQLGAFAKSSEDFATANLQYHVQPLTLEKFGEPLHPFPAFTASVCNLRPESRGHVRIKSPDPSAAPAIQLNYLAAERDKQVAADAIRLTRRIVLETEAMKPYQPEEFMPGSNAQSEDELVKAAGDIGTTIFHPVSTCKMGSDPLAVVDDRLRVHGIERLRVADASIMPTITSGNTNSPTLMIAEKAADMILEDARA
ncbi:MAG: GMC family oxidoreductase N-terminal domain-containing protein [Pseudomonadota bacterium]